MNDEKSTSNPTATAELDQHPTDNTKHADRRTDAGLGMFERVNSIVGTTGIGTAPSVGGATEQSVDLDALPGISGVEAAPIGMPEGDSAELSKFDEDDDRHWREVHTSKPLANAASNYEEYQPAYQYGTEAARRLEGKSWNDAEGHLEQGWDKAKGESSLTWAHVKDAVRDAWHRITGDTDPASR